MEVVCYVIGDNGMPGVVPALSSSTKLYGWTKNIDELAFPLIF